MSSKQAASSPVKLVQIKTSNGASLALPQPYVRSYDIDINQLLGYGSYGFVFRSKRIGNPNNVYAIKCVLLQRLGKRSIENIINEIAILKMLKNRFIVELYDFHYDPSYIYLVLEYCPGGDLGSLISLKRNFPEEIVQHFLQQLATAMKYLRGHNISHMDLKPQNILISGVLFINLYKSLDSFEIWRNIVLKIGDFGFSQYLSNEQHCQSVRGSPLYMAPEVLLGKSYDARVDLWSLGIIMYECLYGRPPYARPHTEDLVKLFSSPNKFQIQLAKTRRISQQCSSLLTSMLEIDAQERITFDQFFAHPFLDLEHMPSLESLEKAEALLLEAAREEKNENHLQAFYGYREALNYLMPIYRWGTLSCPFSKTKQEALRARIVKYMDKAEKLYRNLDVSQLNPRQLELIQTIFDLIGTARRLKHEGQLEDSLESYTQAIEQTLSFFKNQDTEIRKQFFGELNVWLTEAENVKLTIEEKKNPASKISSEKRSASMRVGPRKSSNLDDGCQASKSVNNQKRGNHINMNIFKMDKTNLDDEITQREEPKCYIQ